MNVNLLKNRFLIKKWTANEWYTAFIAILPLISIYNLPILNISVGTMGLILFAPYAVYVALSMRQNTRRIDILSIALFYLFLAVRAGGDVKQSVLYIVAFCNLWGIARGILNCEEFKEILIKIAVLNAILVFIQCIFHYLLGENIHFILYQMLHNDYKETYYGVVSKYSLYRPSGLFLEPSHCAEYCLFALCAALLSDNKKPVIKEAIIVAAGIIFSTSGMGILLTAFVFVWYIASYGDSITEKTKHLFKSSIILCVCILILMIFPFFRDSITRVFSNYEGYNAIDGRMGHWNNAINSLHGYELWIGQGAQVEFPFYLTGFPDTMYHYGIIGIVLEGFMFLSVMLKNLNNYVLCSGITGAILFCIAHMTGIFAHVFYYSIIMIGVLSLPPKERKIRFEKSGLQYKEEVMELSLEEIKSIEYDLLTDVADFCDKNDIDYFLVCGTALGAVRHSGFIPWDDDVDIGIPRPDYEGFVKTYKSDKCYVIDNSNSGQYPYAFAKVCDKSTELVEEIEKPFPLGVYIDVFPIDGAPTDTAERKKHIRRINWDLRLLSWKRISRKKKMGFIHKVLQIIAKFIFAPVPVSHFVNKLDRDVKKYPYSSAEYVGHFVTKSKWGNDVKPKRIFEEKTKHVFENDLFWIPKQYDEYLTLEYGDYRKLPSIEKQKTHHDYRAYKKEQIH